MWTWSISAAGTKESVMAQLNAQTCQKNDDGSDQPQTAIDQFNKAKSVAIAKVAALSPGAYVEVGISGHATAALPTVLFRQTAPGPSIGTMVSA